MKESANEVTKEQLVADFKVALADAEELINATLHQGGEKLGEVRSKAEASLKVAKARINETQAELLLRTKAAAKATDVYVHEHPWTAVGTAAGFGLIIGLLLGRR